MSAKRYTVNNITIENLLDWIKEGRVGLPEMQRPFVWKSTQVRDLIDSLYNGYPIGYIVTWENPDAALKKWGQGSEQRDYYRWSAKNNFPQIF